MAMGKRERDRQPAMWVAIAELPTAASHPFYRRLNQLLREQGFDDFTEAQCATFYAETMGRPGLAPGVYFRLLLIGYFEGIDSERGVAWRAADSLGLRDFLGVGLDEAPPDHSTISRTRRLIDLETHRAVFTWVLQCLSTAGLVKGKTIGIDATTLEANAALRSIVRRDSDERYEEFLTNLATASGISTPTRADLARLDRRRKKKGYDWTHPHDPDAKITKMKDGRTHLAHKAEHAVDLETGSIVAVTVQGADQGDTTTIDQTLAQTVVQLIAVDQATTPPIAIADEIVADKGYHSRAKLRELKDVGFRLYQRTGSPDPRLGRSTRRTRRGVCESAADSRRARSTAAAEARGTVGTPERAPVRDRRHATRPSARSHEYSEAHPRACERIQSRAPDAPRDRRGHAARPSGPPGRSDRAGRQSLGQDGGHGDHSIE